MAASVGLGLATSAHAITFGADLAATPANDAPNTTCAHLPPGALFQPVGSPSCMWSYIGSGTSTLVAPARGVVNAVRVKVGATTGPMRVNVIRFLFRQTGDAAHPFSAGPFLETYGPQFTPAANAVTTVPASLSMKVDPTPALTDTTTIQVIDALALEVQAANVPVPYFAAAGALTYPVYPGPTAQGLPAPSPNGLPTYGTIGFGVLMSADLTPDAGAPAPGPAPAVPTPTARPTVRLPATGTVRNGATRLPIVCQVADCSGLISLLRGAGAATATAKRTTALGSAKFSAKAGTTKRVTVKLNRAGKRLLAKSRRVKVTARVTFTAGGGAPVSVPLTLRR